MERRKKIAVELSDLVVYCRPVPFNEDSKDQRARPFSSTCFYLFKSLMGCAAASRDWDGASLLQGHVVLPRDEGGEVCDPQQREAVPAVQPAAAFQSLPSRTEAGLVQLRPSSHVALRLPAGRAQLSDPR